MRNIKLRFVLIFVFYCIAMLSIIYGKTIETKYSIKTDNYILDKNPDTGVVESITNQKGKGITDKEMMVLLKHKDVKGVILTDGYCVFRSILPPIPELCLPLNNLQWMLN